MVVEAHAKRGEIGVLLAPQGRHRESAYGFHVIAPRVLRMLGAIRRSDLADVFAVIAIGGKRCRRIVTLTYPSLDAQRQVFDLCTCIVVVELPMNLMALPLQQRRNRSA